jgi:CheY-like chemotaxis protein
MTDGAAPVVLVVEDDPGIRATILRCLRGFGFDARSSVDRAEILAQVAAGACAAILLDLGLPDDDGIEIARAIRSTSAIPILSLTGRARKISVMLPKRTRSPSTRASVRTRCVLSLTKVPFLESRSRSWRCSVGGGLPPSVTCVV